MLRWGATGAEGCLRELPITMGRCGEGPTCAQTHTQRGSASPQLERLQESCQARARSPGAPRLSPAARRRGGLALRTARRRAPERTRHPGPRRSASRGVSLSFRCNFWCFLVFPLFRVWLWRSIALEVHVDFNQSPDSAARLLLPVLRPEEETQMILHKFYRQLGNYLTHP